MTAPGAPTSSTPTTPPAGGRPPSRPRPGSGGSLDRRAIWGAAALLAVVIIGGVVLVTVASDPGMPKGAKAGATYDDGKPRIIQRPNSGTPPQHPGDRGGWEQLTLLGLIVVAVGAIGVVAVRSGGARARANREAWRAAAEADHDGAIDP